MDIGSLVASIGADMSGLKKTVTKANSEIVTYVKNTDKELKKADKRWSEAEKAIKDFEKNVKGDLNKAQADFEKYVKDTEADLKKAAKDIQDYEKRVKKELMQAAKDADHYQKQNKRSLDKMDKDWVKSSKSLNGVLKTMKAAVLGYFTVLGTMYVKDFIVDLVRTGTELDSLNRSFKAITGSAQGAGAQIQFVNDIAKELGLSLQPLEQGYKNILAASKGTALEGEGVQKVFRSVVEASAALGMSADDTTGTLRALSQMMSKGNVQAEELRGQLGERLPGAFIMAAEAMGVSTKELNKMLEQGQVLADDMLPKLADVLSGRFSKAAIEAFEGPRAAFATLSNSILEFQRMLSTSGIVENFAKVARSGSDAINDLRAEIATKGTDINNFLNEIGDSFEHAFNSFDADDMVQALEDTYMSVKKIVDLYQSLPTSVTSGVGAGLVGKMLFGGKAGGLIFLITQVNAGMHTLGMGLSDMVEKYQALNKVTEDFLKAAKLTKEVGLEDTFDPSTVKTYEDLANAVSAIEQRIKELTVSSTQYVKRHGKPLWAYEQEKAIVALTEKLEKLKKRKEELILIDAKISAREADRSDRDYGIDAAEKISAVELARIKTLERMKGIYTDIARFQGVVAKEMKSVNDYIDSQTMNTYDLQLKKAEETYLKMRETYKKYHDDTSALDAAYVLEVKAINDARIKNEQEVANAKLKIAKEAADKQLLIEMELLDEKAKAQGKVARSWYDIDKLNKDDLQKLAEMAAKADFKAWQDALKEKDKAHRKYLKEQEKDLKKAQKEWERIYDDMHTFASDTFYDLFTGELNNFSDFAESMLNIWKRMLANMAASAAMTNIFKPILANIAGSALGDFFGLPGSSSSGGFSIGDIFSAGKSILSGNNPFQSFTGGLTASQSAIGASSHAAEFTGLSSSGGPAGGLMGTIGAGVALSAAGFLASKWFSDYFSDDPAASFLGAEHRDFLQGGYGTGRDSEFMYPGGENPGNVVKSVGPAGVGKSPAGYDYWVAVKDTERDPAVQKQIWEFFDTMFGSLEESFGISVNNVLKDHKYMGHSIEFNSGKTLKDMSDAVAKELIPDLLAEIFPDAGTVMQEYKALVGQKKNTYDFLNNSDLTARDSYEWMNANTGGNENYFTAVYETLTREVSVLAEHLNDEFFQALGGENGMWAGFSAFAQVASQSTTFLEDFTRQIEEFGETSIQAFQNVQKITSVMSAVDAQIAAITELTEIQANLQATDMAWVELIATLDGVHATVEQLNKAEQGRAIALGSMISGLTASSLQQSMMSGGDIGSIINKNLKTALSSTFAEQIAKEYILPINEQIGQAYLDSAGDMQTVAAVVSGLDFSGAEAAVADFHQILNQTFGDAVDDATEYKRTLDAATQRYQSALSATISDLSNQLSALVDRASTAKDAYIRAIDADISAQEAALSSFQNMIQGQISAMEDQQRALEADAADAKQNYLSALNAEISAQKQLQAEAAATAREMEQAAEDLHAARLKIRSGTSSAAGYTVAKSEYDSAIHGAFARDMDAIQSLPELALEYQQYALSRASTQAEYQSVSDQIYMQLATVESIVSSQMGGSKSAADIAESQLKALEAQRDSVQNSDQTLMSLTDATEAYHKAKLALDSSDIERQIAQHQNDMSTTEEQFKARIQWAEDQKASIDGVNETTMSIAEAAEAYHEAQLALEQSGLEQQISQHQQQLASLESITKAVLSLPAALEGYLNAGGIDVTGASVTGVHGPSEPTAPSINDFNSAAALYNADPSAVAWNPYGTGEGQWTTQSVKDVWDAWKLSDDQFADRFGGMTRPDDPFAINTSLSVYASRPEMAYLSDKAMSLNANAEAAAFADEQFGHSGNWTSDDVAAAFAAAGLTPKQHYEQYGQNEGLTWQSFSGGGIATGPDSGYPALMHGTELVLPFENGSVRAEINSPPPIDYTAPLESLVSGIAILNRRVDELHDLIDDWMIGRTIPAVSVSGTVTTEAVA